jgi:hypothetical protein
MDRSLCSLGGPCADASESLGACHTLLERHDPGEKLAMAARTIMALTPASVPPGPPTCCAWLLRGSALASSTAQYRPSYHAQAGVVRPWNIIVNVRQSTAPASPAASRPSRQCAVASLGPSLHTANDISRTPVSKWATAAVRLVSIHFSPGLRAILGHSTSFHSTDAPDVIINECLEFRKFQ